MKEVSAADTETNTDSWEGSWGAFLIGIGGVFAVWSLTLKSSSVGGEHDLGPAAFPMALAIGLILCGAVDGWKAIRRRARISQSKAPTRPQTLAGDWRRFAAAAGSLPVCLASIAAGAPYSLATLGLAVFWMRLCRVSWRASFTSALALVVLIKVVFTYGFGVQLPDGPLDLALYRIGWM